MIHVGSLMWELHFSSHLVHQSEHRQQMVMPTISSCQLLIIIGWNGIYVCFIHINLWSLDNGFAYEFRLEKIMDSCHQGLHWGLNEMVGILQDAIEYIFANKRTLIKFHSCLSLTVQTRQYWFKEWPGAEQLRSMTPYNEYYNVTIGSIEWDGL